MTRRGVLRIRQSRPSDAGVYTCTAAAAGGGRSSADTTLRFHAEDDALVEASARLAALSADDGGGDSLAAERQESTRDNVRPFEQRPRSGDPAAGSFSISYMLGALVSDR